MTLGYHVVKSAYGLWLPGDERGSWSEAWDNELGFIEPHTLHPYDPVRKRMAEERMKHPPVRFTPATIDTVARTLGRCQDDSPWRIIAASIEPTHTHLLIPYSGLDIYNTVKWLADQTTKAVHRETARRGPLWCKGAWVSFIFDNERWVNVKAYIEQHNLRRGEPAKPYDFLHQ